MTTIETLGLGLWIAGSFAVCAWAVYEYRRRRRDEGVSQEEGLFDCILAILLSPAISPFAVLAGAVLILGLPILSIPWLITKAIIALGGNDD